MGRIRLPGFAATAAALLSLSLLGSQTLLDDLRRAVGENPHSELHQMNLARALIQRSLHQEAKEALAEALVHHADSPRLRYMKALVDERLGDSQAAAQTYRRLLADVPDFPPPYVALARLLSRQGRAAEAAASLEQALDRGLGSPLLLLLYADTRLEAQPGQKLPRLEQLLAKPFRDQRLQQRARLTLGRYHLDLGQPHLALVQAEQVLGVQPGQPEALYLAGRALKAQGDLPGARERLARAAARLESQSTQTGSNPDLSYRLGLIHQELSDFETAAEHFRKGVAMRPAYEGLIQIGRVLFELDRRHEAAGYLEQARELNPERADAYYYLGLRAETLGRYQEAADLLAAAVAAENGHVPGLLALGRIQFQSGRIDEAELSLAKAVEMRPEDAEGLYWLGRTRARSGDSTAAAALWQRALKADPDHVPSHYQLALHHQQQGRRQKSRSHLEQVQRINRLRAESRAQSHPNQVYRSSR